MFLQCELNWKKIDNNGNTMEIELKLGHWNCWALVTADLVDIMVD